MSVQFRHIILKGINWSIDWVIDTVMSECVCVSYGCRLIEFLIIIPVNQSLTTHAICRCFHIRRPWLSPLATLSQAEAVQTISLSHFHQVNDYILFWHEMSIFRLHLGSQSQHIFLVHIVLQLNERHGIYLHTYIHTYVRTYIHMWFVTPSAVKRSWNQRRWQSWRLGDEGIKIKWF